MKLEFSERALNEKEHKPRKMRLWVTSTRCLGITKGAVTSPKLCVSTSKFMVILDQMDGSL